MVYILKTEFVFLILNVNVYRWFPVANDTAARFIVDLRKLWIIGNWYFFLGFLLLCTIKKLLLISLTLNLLIFFLISIISVGYWSIFKIVEYLHLTWLNWLLVKFYVWNNWRSVSIGRHLRCNLLHQGLLFYNVDSFFEWRHKLFGLNHCRNEWRCFLPKCIWVCLFWFHLIELFACSMMALFFYRLIWQEILRFLFFILSCSIDSVR